MPKILHNFVEMIRGYTNIQNDEIREVIYFLCNFIVPIFFSNIIFMEMDISSMILFVSPPKDNHNLVGLQSFLIAFGEQLLNELYSEFLYQ